MQLKELIQDRFFLITTFWFPAATLGDRQLLVEDEEAEEEDSGNDPR